MKRPEGFDPPARAERETGRSGTKPERRTRVSAEKVQQPAPLSSAAKRPQPTTTASAPGAAPRPRDDHGHKRTLRSAASERRKFERSEVRRFTKRTRTRRAVGLTLAAVAAALVTVFAVAIFSPLLALRTITIDGTTLVDSQEVLDAVDGQLGTPLALVDFDRLKRQLAEFPLIRSYVTETTPPDTIAIHIVEREPVAVLANGDVFSLVDPAGIVVQSTGTRPAGLPLITKPAAADDPAFSSVVEVLLALPDELLARIDSISAGTQDDVTLVLRGVGQTVVWGSADRSELKARVLDALVVKQNPDVVLEYDVSAPESVVVTRK